MYMFALFFLFLRGHVTGRPTLSSCVFALKQRPPIVQFLFTMLSYLLYKILVGAGSTSMVVWNVLELAQNESVLLQINCFLACEMEKHEDFSNWKKFVAPTIVCDNNIFMFTRAQR